MESVEINNDEVKTKKQKKFYNKACFWIIVAFFVFGIIINSIAEVGSEVSKAENNKKTEIKVETAEQKAERLEQAKAAKAANIKKRTKTLSTGKYVVGEDISAGKYNAIAKSGNGNLIIMGASLFDIKVNEMFGVSDEDYYTKTYNNVTLEDGDTIEITSGLKVLFKAK